MFRGVYIVGKIIERLTKVSISASLVVYKPDLQVLGRALFALDMAAKNAKNHYLVHLKMTLVDNSNDADWHLRLLNWVNEHADEWSEWSLQLLKAPGNIGYGRGNNLVIEQTQSDYHIVINPDLFVEANTLFEAVTFMQSNLDVGLLTPLVLSEDGEREYLCKRNPTLFIMFLRGFAPSWLKSLFKARLDFFEMRDCNYDLQIENIQFPSGCFMFFRTSYLRQIDGFDSRFFMYMEDADIGRRMLKTARVVYVPTVKVVHKWGRGTHTNLYLRWVTIQSVFIYWKKWGGVI